MRRSNDGAVLAWKALDRLSGEIDHRRAVLCKTLSKPRDVKAIVALTYSRPGQSAGCVGDDSRQEDKPVSKYMLQVCRPKSVQQATLFCL